MDGRRRGTACFGLIVLLGLITMCRSSAAGEDARIAELTKAAEAAHAKVHEALIEMRVARSNAGKARRATKSDKSKEAKDKATKTAQESQVKKAGYDKAWEVCDAAYDKLREAVRPRLMAELKQLPYKIVRESYREKNWDLILTNADGSNPVNLTKTPDIHEMYAKASPDGTKIAFVADQGKSSRSRTRDLYCMNVDGSDKKLICKNARQPCWSPDGKYIAYVKQEFPKWNFSAYATKGMFLYDIETGKHRQHPNDKIEHICAVTWIPPDGKWFLATMHGGMGFSHTSLLLEANGTKVKNYHRMRGCRPDVSLDGKRVAWTLCGDAVIAVRKLDECKDRPKKGERVNAIFNNRNETYHADWSPDGKYIAFSCGPRGGSQQVGQMAKGWDICVAPVWWKGPLNVWAAITTDGCHNKEPDWVPVKSQKK